MSYRHKKHLSPSERLAQQGLLYGAEKEKARPTPPKGKRRADKARKEFLRAAEALRRAERMLVRRLGA